MFTMQSINLKCEISKPYRWAVNFPWQAHENKCKCRFLNWATFGRVDAWNFHGAQSNRWCKVKLHKSHLNLKISGLLMLPFFSRPAVWIFCIILSDEAFKVDVALELLSFWGILVFKHLIRRCRLRISRTTFFFWELKFSTKIISAKIDMKDQIQYSDI